MKKTLILAASLFLIIGATQAQHNGVHFGLKAGMNASSLTNYNSDSKIGFNAGALAHIHTSSKSWAIQPELVYSLEGAKSKTGGEGNAKVSTNLSYLNVPVLVQYLFSNGFRIEAGPQIGFLMSAKDKVGSNTAVDIKDFFNTTNFSVPVGLGYLTSYGLGFDARYNFGVSNVVKNVLDSKKVHANTFQFDLFYQFSDSKMKK